jgi:hypothetical protein
MLYHKLFCKRHIGRYFVGFSALFLTFGTLHAQESGEQKSYTAPRETHEWVFLGNSETSKWEYDQRTMLRLDSEHIRVRVKETPLKNSYSDVRGAKMWQMRSIQGYSDSLRLHPQFYYEGYERFGYSILEENIDLIKRTYIVHNAADYDLGGLLLTLWEDGYDVEKPISKSSPEEMLINMFFNRQSKNIGEKLMK